MSGGDDWGVGDLALCVNDTPHPYHGPCPIRRGSVRTVAHVWPPAPNVLFGVSAGLDFVGIASGAPEGFAARRFIKVTPREADEFDRETIALLTGKPAKVGA